MSAETRDWIELLDLSNCALDWNLMVDSECLVAIIEQMRAEMKTQTGFLTSQMGSYHEMIAEMRDHLEEMKALKDANLEKIESCLGVTEVCTENTKAYPGWMEANRERMVAYQEELEANPEESEAVAEHREVPNEETAVETIGEVED
jgi:hypothetical protein